MSFTLKHFFLLGMIFFSFNSSKIETIATIDKKLTEVSAAEMLPNSDLIWVIEDSGNKNNIYGLNEKGAIERNITVENSKNIDWEDLTTDEGGNLYIGDFGNNSKKRKNFTIYKLTDVTNTKGNITAEIINFKLPEDTKSEDFEAFFVKDGCFYIFTKDYKKNSVFRVENEVGNQVASFVCKYDLKGKNNRVTSADISDDGDTIILLNHDKIWEITNFKDDTFFEGDVKALEFNHNSQKEGVAFKDKNTIIITDERNKNDGKIYSFKL